MGLAMGKPLESRARARGGSPRFEIDAEDSARFQLAGCQGAAWPPAFNWQRSACWLIPQKPEEARRHVEYSGGASKS